MDHWHCNLLEIKALLFGFQLVGGVYIQCFSPDTIGKKDNCFLTDQIALLQSAGDWNKLHLWRAPWNYIHQSAVARGSLQMVGWSHQRGKIGTVQVIAGMLPVMLLRVKRRCVCFVFFNVRFLVGFGAAMMGGAFVICLRGKTSGTLCSMGMSVTLVPGG